ncbi:MULTISPECIES: hypothetical protein [Vibrio]|uniref:hypothetical protein n=1 Tax=Vibrio TaxID=662 RepID=UPI003D0F7ED1
MLRLFNQHHPSKSKTTDILPKDDWVLFVQGFPSQTKLAVTRLPVYFRSLIDTRIT